LKNTGWQGLDQLLRDAQRLVLSSRLSSIPEGARLLAEARRRSKERAMFARNCFAQALLFGRLDAVAALQMADSGLP